MNQSKASRFARAALLVVAVLAIGGDRVVAQTTQAYHGHGIAPFVCRVTAATVTTECKTAPAAGLRAYVTDMIVSNNVGTAQTLKLVTGTGSNCGTGTTDLTHAVQFGAAVGNFNHPFSTAPIAPLATAVCVAPSAATSFSATLSGFVGP